MADNEFQIMSSNKYRHALKSTGNWLVWVADGKFETLILLPAPVLKH
jgi:hypothetical protein